MGVFQQTIASWLSRSVPDRGVIQCFDLPAVVLSTDKGLLRDENQDRVAAMSVSSAIPGSQLVAIAVADGMGGMRDGAKCATLAISSFFHALSRSRSEDIEVRANTAIEFANDSVFRFASGKGGSTLSAIIADGSKRSFIVHLGDSRIYAFGQGEKVSRLTIDDSLAEAVGGHGRELLQFIGMGPGMKAHVQPIDSTLSNLAITTDGIHFVEPPTLQKILAHTSSNRAAAERLAALARWCGGPDNASAAIIDLQSLLQHVDTHGEGGIKVWDAFGSLTAVWIEEELPVTSVEPSKPGIDVAISHQSIPGKSLLVKDDKKSTSAGSRRGKKRDPKKEIQLEIKIERSDERGESEDDSR